MFFFMDLCRIFYREAVLGTTRITSFFSLVRAYSDMACGACGSELRYIKGTQDGAGRISYTFYFCDGCDVEWRLRRRKE